MICPVFGSIATSPAFSPPQSFSFFSAPSFTISSPFFLKFIVKSSRNLQSSPLHYFTAVLFFQIIFYKKDKMRRFDVTDYLRRKYHDLLFGIVIFFFGYKTKFFHSAE